ncbi:translation initiation factor IF-2 [Streptobacillus moniliformis]|uniref:Translation initiation factor IF-2 n=1 Tax=Streptobacillus moniliformis (strain ATCC 14647 / DSM 12112 / NCTC 10651 / 9901) TaxID=519441 RepID=D1AY64_STRM9|nr:translation initiation factor IF-2 [Streptobacillus moniliformis]ACZ01240.1 translation initiation factor IF-2 [Streptobacillus moniliformis DSM 12112]AVL42402.1 translation initiation factor IF-2 [Streptobacillus moniliformis]QXW65986.1 translation initiation factor IF-2 [Streptobacillus moniliformis]SQA13605.1 Translation initiation factor IF-2 [Streptobacillus moniliformis]
MRVYEFAKKIGQSTNDLITKLKIIGYDKTSLSALSDSEIKDIENKLNPVKSTEKTSSKKEEVIGEKIIFNNKNHNKFNKNNKFRNDKFDRNERENRGERQEKNNQNFGERKPFEKRNNQNFGERKPFNRDNKDTSERNNNERKNNFRSDKPKFENKGNFNKDRDNRERNRDDNRVNKDNRNFNNNNGERKPFEKRNNQNFGDRKPFENGERRPFNKDRRNDDNKKGFKTHAKEEKEAVIEIPTMENDVKAKNSKLKSKFEKKKYENDRKTKDEERKLKELRDDFRKEDKKKKVKKKEKVVKSEVIRDEEGGVGLVVLPQEISIKELAEKLGINSSDIIKKFFMQGKMYTANAILNIEEAEEIALEYNVIVEKEEIVEISYGEKYNLEIEDKEEDKELRAPVITIMGHVDHGKTSLLDALRHTNVIDGEAGGITQRIGAYQVEWNGQKITFIDTPGHEAFTEMRVRGANITDISILIVAADDGVKPQTIEAISHAKEANVPIIVAINKIDKPGANPMKVKQELLEHGLISPEWGGNTEMVEISAKQKLNLDSLLETILLTSEIMELKANHKKRAKAIVVESRLDVQMGPVADVLIQEGELKIGDIFVSGTSYGRVRSMLDDRGNKITKAGVSQPVEITGFNEIPEAGDLLYCVNNDKQAKKIVEDFKNEKKDELNKKKHISLESLSKELEDQQLKELKCIIRADSKGSAEALKESINKLSNDKISINIIQASAGAVTEGDVMLAAASNAIIIAFSVRPTNTARTQAEKTGVEIRNYNVIYHVTEDLEKAMKGMLDPEYKEIYNGRLEVREVFKISNVGNIAGSLIIEGKITRQSKIRLLRDGIIIHEGEIASLKRYKDDVKEATVGQDCGIGIKDFNDIKAGDIIEAFVVEQVKQ